MAKVTQYQTGDAVPATGNYTTTCDNAVQNLAGGGLFPPCPTCHLAASWRPT